MQNRFELFKNIINLSVYTLSAHSSDLINQGEDLFARAMVKEFYWAQDFSILSIVVKAKKKQIVLFSIDQEGIAYTCDCQSGGDICVHIIAAVIALNYFLVPSSVEYSPYSDQQYNRMRDSLLYGNCFDDSAAYSFLPPGISICLFPKFFVKSFSTPQLACFVIKDGKIMLPQECEKIPELVNFSTISYQQNSVESFMEHISPLVDKYPLYVFNNALLNLVRWDENFFLQAITEINLMADGRVHIRRLGYYNEILVDGIVYLGDTLVLDTKTFTLGRVTAYESHPWGLADEWQEEDSRPVVIPYEDFPLVSKPFEIKVDVFNKKSSFIFLPEQYLSRIFIFKKNGRLVVPESIAAHAKMTIHHQANGESLLKGTISCLGVAIDSWDSNGIEKLMKSSRAKVYRQLPLKSKASWLKGYFAASCAKNRKELHAIINEVSSVLTVQSSLDVKKQVAVPFASAYRKAQKQGNAERLFIHNNSFYVIAVDYKKYWLLLALPRLVFDKCRHLVKQLESFVDTDKVNPSLGVFKDLLKNYDIDLYVDAKQVKSAQFDIAIDTRKDASNKRKKAANWFELHPEVYYDDQKISSQEWRKIVAGGGVWDRKDEILVVDAQAYTALGLLSHWISSEKSVESTKGMAIIPRLRMFDIIELRKNGVKVKVSAEDETILHNLSHFTAIPKVAVPKKLKCSLRTYQKEGYYWLAFLYQHQFGACLADDMGLGKTVQAIALLGALKEGIIGNKNNHKPHLIVVPTSLVFNWVNEIKTFYPDFTVQEYTTTKMPLVFDSTDIIITTYDIVRRDSKQLSSILFNVIIFDEAQIIKNITAKRTSAARLLQSDFKLCITGTPLENHIGEYYSIMDLAIPGLLPHYSEFKNSGSSGADRIVAQTRPFILRRTKEIIARELPAKIESDVYFYMTEKQRSLYTRITQEVRSQVALAYKNKNKGQASIVALTALLRLRQICISPELVVHSKKPELGPKIEYLVEQLPGLIAIGHAALVFSQFTQCLDILEKELQAVGVKYARIDGSVSLLKRKVIIESFQKDKIVDVLLMSLKTGGVGLNLTRASYIFHVDPWWNAAVENQASDRAYRIGQKNTVMVIRLLMHHSIEEKMLVLKKGKQELFKAIVEGAGEKIGSSITHSDFDFLLD